MLIFFVAFLETKKLLFHLFVLAFLLDRATESFRATLEKRGSQNLGITFVKYLRRSQKLQAFLPQPFQNITLQQVFFKDSTQVLINVLLHLIFPKDLSMADSGTFKKSFQQRNSNLLTQICHTNVRKGRSTERFSNVFSYLNKSISIGKSHAVTKI